MATKKAMKKAKQSWIPMHAPEFLNKAYLGDTLAKGEESLPGKTLTLNMSTFTNDMKKQNAEVSFVIKSVVDKKALTDMTGMKLTNSFVKRLARKGRSKVEDSFTVKSQNGKNLRVKPVIITTNKTTNSLNSRIRLEAKSLITEYVSKHKDEDIFSDIMNQKIQKELKQSLSKIYPLRNVEIRQIKIVK